MRKRCLSQRRFMEVLAVDEIDEKILEILKRDARTPYTEIAKQVGLSEGAVRKRVKALVDSGVIKRFTIELSRPSQVGAVVLISVSTSTPTANVSKEIRKLSGVQDIYEVTGQYDIATIVLAENIDKLNDSIDAIRSIPGILNTNTMIILKKWS